MSIFGGLRLRFNGYPNGPHTLGVLFINDRNDQGFVPNVVNGGINVVIDNH